MISKILGIICLILSGVVFLFTIDFLKNLTIYGYGKEIMIKGWSYILAISLFRLMIVMCLCVGAIILLYLGLRVILGSVS